MARPEAGFDERCVRRQAGCSVVPPGFAYGHCRQQSGFHRRPDTFAATFASHTGSVAYQQASVGNQWAA